MSGGDVDGGAIGGKIAYELIKRTAPKGVAWITAYARGVELLVVGPGGAGKTSFFDYLRFGVLEQKGPHEKTHEIKKSPTFTISMGRDGALNLRLRRSVDTPGQIGPVEHANLVGKRKPHILVIVLDGGLAQSTAQRWIRDFGARLEELAKEDSSIFRKLRFISVILNKRDKIGTNTQLKSFQKAVKKALKESLANVLGASRTNRIPILPTISIEHNDATKLLDAVIRKIGKSLAK